MGVQKHLVTTTLKFGCDPELFFVKKGTAGRKYPTVVGAEKVRFKCPTIVPDGVQVELHPDATPCRALIGNTIGRLLPTVQQLAEQAGLEVCWNQVVTVSRQELSTLSLEAQQLGCMPSFNIYGRSQKMLDGLTYRKRSAAGHLHLGSTAIDRGVIKQKAACISPKLLVPLLDILVGLPMVMIDRDPAATVRRKYYGKAGEYRLPTHGLEYRTLSNFWLRDYKLMSLVMGQARTAVYLAYGSSIIDELSLYPSAQFARHEAHDIITTVSLPTVEKAINTNDIILAHQEFDKVKPILDTITITDGIANHTPTSGPNKDYWKDWDYFLSRPLEEWLPGIKDPITAWASKGDGHGKGWESFFTGRVHEARRASEASTKKEVRA